MEQILKNIDLDIKRCEDTLNENSYLEIVITIEEIQDKYDIFKNNQSNVWNYKKSDLENIKVQLLNHKKEIIKKDLINNINLIKDNEILKNSLQEIISISDESITKQQKWDKLKKYIQLAQHQDFQTGHKILEIIIKVIS